jgi:ATP-dependent RNA/DNA helicase IGHMBP2
MDPPHDHLTALAAALADEQRWQADEHARLLRLPWPDRVEAGVCWPHLQVVSAEPQWQGQELVLRGAAPLHDGIGAGDSVLIAPAGAEGAGRNGFVVEVEGKDAVVRLPDDPGPTEAPLEGTVAVTRQFDPRTFQRYRDALRTAATLDTPLVRALLGERSAVDVAPFPLPGLDAAQAVAAGHALSEGPLALVHGPPGTGKTWLLARVLAELVRRGERPWALAESNAAVDHLALAAAGQGLDVLRLGHPGRIGPAARALGLDERLRRGPFAAALAALEKELRRVSGSDRAAWAERRRLRSERRRIRDQAWEHAVGGAEVLACTFGSLARLIDRLPATTTAVVDEATQALEPAVWVAAPKVARLVLVGDPEQLGPVVMQPGNPLEEGLLQRLLREGGLPMPMLETQHRMSADVQRLVAPVYGPGYRPSDAVADQRLGDGGLGRRSLLWIDTAGAGFDEERDPVSRSLRNPGEARLVLAVLDRLRREGVEPAQVGVITPYSAQAALLRAAAPEGVEVASVNAFQGREKDVIVASWVRSNDRGDVGFVADGRRLTVALSRARCLLVQIGDSATLGGQPRFAEQLEALAAAGALESVWEEAWQGAMETD